MLTLDRYEIEFVKDYKKQVQKELIQLIVLKNKEYVGIPFVNEQFIKTAEKRMCDLEFIYNIFDKLENEL